MFFIGNGGDNGRRGEGNDGDRDLEIVAMDTIFL
jgi:hypothetical protein